MYFSHLLIRLLAVLAIPFFSGCVAVPHTTVTGTISGQPFKIVSPKDSDLSGLDISVSNGMVRVHIDALKARMNPDVIGTAAAGQAQIIQATAAAISDASAKLLQGYLASQGVIAPKPSPVPP